MSTSALTSPIMRGSKLLALAFGPLLLGCSDGSGPDGEGFTGTYELVEANFQPIPAVIGIDGFTGDSLMATGGSVSRLSRGRIRTVFESEWRTKTQGVITQTPDTAVLTYREEGNRILIDHPEGIPAPYTDTITVHNRALHFRTTAGGARLVLIYQGN